MSNDSFERAFLAEIRKPTYWLKAALGVVVVIFVLAVFAALG